jgi:hypothetical protein
LDKSTGISRPAYRVMVLLRLFRTNRGGAL